MAFSLELPRWYDLHAHFRQDGLMAPLVADHLKMGCAGILAMPNTKPPVSKVFENDSAPGWSIEAYLEMLRRAGGKKFQDIIVPLYLTREATPQMVEAGAKAGVLRACKYYPPHGTTNAEHGEDLKFFMGNGVFAAMEAAGIVLCVHGEAHGLAPEDYFARGSNAEDVFYRESMPALAEKFPRLKIACEHVTTRTAVDFVRAASANVAASITPQHLLYTVGDLLQGLKYHLYCLPLVKFAEDREALRAAAADSKGRKFYAGTDSAPHAQKVTECGCAAGCYTGGIAPQLYAQAFEEAGADLETEKGAEAFLRFLCFNGPEFYGLEKARGSFVLEKAPEACAPTKTAGVDIVPLPLGMAKTGKATLGWRIAAVKA